MDEGFNIEELLAEQEEPRELTLDELKAQKRVELTKRKRQVQGLPVPVGDYHFFGGSDDADKYDKTYRLAQLAGLDKITCGVIEGDVEFTLDELKVALITLGQRLYTIWATAKHLRIQIDAATTQDELDGINIEALQ